MRRGAMCQRNMEAGTRSINGSGGGDGACSCSSQAGACEKLWVLMWVILTALPPPSVGILRVSSDIGAVAGTAKYPEKRRFLSFMDGVFHKIPPIIPPNVLARRISGRLERRPAHQSQGPCGAEPTIRFGHVYRPENCRLDPHTVRDKSQPKSQQFRGFRQMAASPSNLTCGLFPSHFQFNGAK